MDLLEQEKKIEDKIKEKYTAYLTEKNYAAPDEWVDDAPLDMDKYKKSFTVYFDFGKNTFSKLSNISDRQDIELTIYIVVRNSKDSELKDKNLNYVSCLYDCLQNCNGLDGAVDLLTIENINNYRDETLRASSLDVTLSVEEM